MGGWGRGRPETEVYVPRTCDGVATNRQGLGMGARGGGGGGGGWCNNHHVGKIVVMLPMHMSIGLVYRGPQAFLLHGKSDSAARVPLLPLGVQAGQGVPVPPGDPREVDEVVMQRLRLNTL